MNTDEINLPNTLTNISRDTNPTLAPTNANWASNPYIAAATSDNTRKAYRSDVKQYEQSGGLLPATPETIVNYLQAYAPRLNARTLQRRIIALKHWHTYQGFPDPTIHPVVGKTITGITRIHGKPKKKSPALTPEGLQLMVKELHNESTITALRDNAILQIGFFGALRRSEITNLRIEHLRWVNEGIEIRLTSSKTDQTHEGQYVAIPHGNDLLCPVKALKNWLTESNIKDGAVFRRIRRKQSLGSEPLTPLSITYILKHRATKAHLPNAALLTPHSLRRGLATSAARANTNIRVIMQAGRWKQVNTVMEYIEANERFQENAASTILSQLKNMV